MYKLIKNIEYNKIVKRTSIDLKSKDCDFFIVFVRPLTLSTSAFVNGKKIEFIGTSTKEMRFENEGFRLEVKKGKVKVLRFCKYKYDNIKPEDPNNFDFVISGYLI